ncbi:MAG: GldG family protein [Saprospiraceae bacterium]
MKNFQSIILIAGILLLVNLLSREYFYRLDLTDNQQYTLSKATTDILENLEEVVTVNAFFSDNLPPSYEKVKRDFKELLVEYATRSGNMVEYEFISPSDATSFKEAATQNGVPPTTMQVREQDKYEVKEVYLGASLTIGDRKEAIPNFGPGTPMEYMMTTLIKKLSVVDKPSIGLITGHGEAGLESYPQANAGIGILYNLEVIDLNQEASISPRFKTVALIGPKDSIPPAHLKVLDDFLARGGNLFVGIDHTKGDLNVQPPVVSAQNTGSIETWLADKGLTIVNNVLADVNYGSQLTIQMPVQHPIFGQVMQRKPIPFYYVTVIKEFADHPAVKGLEQLVLQFPSEIRYTGDPNHRYTSLAKTSVKSEAFPLPHNIDIQKEWTEMDFSQANLTVGAVLEGKLVGEQQSRIYLVSDAEFAQTTGQNSNLPPDNINLLVNAVDWLSDDTGLIELRTRTVASRPIDELEDSDRQFLKYLNFGLPLLLILIYGFLRFQRQRNLRKKRMQERYN